MIFELMRLRNFVQISVMGAFAFVIGFSSLMYGPAKAQQIILKCTPPLIANRDGTDCIRPAAQAKTLDRLTAFSIRVSDGRHLGLYRKQDGHFWVGPSLFGGGDKQWLQQYDGTSRLTLLSSHGSNEMWLTVDESGTVVSPDLPRGSVLGDRAY
jgi:hypothetical protein